MTAGRADRSEALTLVRVAFLLRLLLLLASMLGFINQALTPTTAAAVIFLALTSMGGLALRSAPELLQRHPILAVVDGLVMTGLMVVLGTDNPLVLVTLSSCMVLGVLLPVWPAALAAVVLVGGYLVATLTDGREEVDFLNTFGFPATFVSVVVLGHLFRLLTERKRRSELAYADLITGAAAAAERSRLARELHDSTAKTLQGLALSAQSLPHWIEHDPSRACAQADEISTTAKDAITRLRRLLAAMRQDDHDQPFHESLETLASAVERTHGIRVVLELEPVPVSAPGVRYELLAAVREAMTNAAVHSGASRIRVSMRVVHDEVRIEVRDDGCGFSLDVLPARELEGHFGVRGYQERLALIGGRADLVTAQGRGTQVHLVAPQMGLREEERAG
ncbi:sensor histidine kinase [Nocardioides gilvus]|uniref:sensor histidine kinase n=1 Tax=Nocardioides gilvus TaxID=1735589 RepID=UPI000D742B25|nr:histidine kinase [Nocardioides gilvus]